MDERICEEMREITEYTETGTEDMLSGENQNPGGSMLMLRSCSVSRKRTRIKKSYRDDRGVAVIEIILVLVVLIALVVIFREQALALVQRIWNAVTNGAAEVTG